MLVSKGEAVLGERLIEGIDDDQDGALIAAKDPSVGNGLTPREEAGND